MLCVDVADVVVAADNAADMVIVVVVANVDADVAVCWYCC